MRDLFGTICCKSLIFCLLAKLTSVDDMGVPPPSAFQIERSLSLDCEGVQFIVGFWVERNNRLLRGVERDHGKICYFVRFHVSLGFGFKGFL